MRLSTPQTEVILACVHAQFGADAQVTLFGSRLNDAAEPYGHGIGVGFILLALYLLAPEQRRALVRISAMSLGAGLASNVLKLFIHRARPAHCEEPDGHSQTRGSHRGRDCGDRARDHPDS